MIRAIPFAEVKLRSQNRSDYLLIRINVSVDRKFEIYLVRRSLDRKDVMQRSEIFEKEIAECSGVAAHGGKVEMEQRHRLHTPPTTMRINLRQVVLRDMYIGEDRLKIFKM